MTKFIIKIDNGPSITTDDLAAAIIAALDYASDEYPYIVTDKDNTPYFPHALQIVAPRWVQQELSQQMERESKWFNQS